MRKVKDFTGLIWELIRGKKSYFVGVCAVVYGIYAHNTEAILLGLGLLGLRHGVSNEITNLFTKLIEKADED